MADGCAARVGRTRLSWSSAVKSKLLFYSRGFVRSLYASRLLGKTDGSSSVTVGTVSHCWFLDALQLICYRYCYVRYAISTLLDPAGDSISRLKIRLKLLSAERIRVIIPNGQKSTISKPLKWLESPYSVVITTEMPQNCLKSGFSQNQNRTFLPIWDNNSNAFCR